ncbi:MAG TPA: cyanophycin synthetase [Gemmatimonadales bacterium]|nr:cyanophycin synthetase [Gemmatimonadales bacterium]
MLQTTIAIHPGALEVQRLRPLRGPNTWSLDPVIACDVVPGALCEVNSADLPGFPDRLLEALPSLLEHPCSVGAPGGFARRLREGTEWPHILEHVALDLQGLAGSDVRFGRVVRGGGPGAWRVVVEYEHEEVGVAAMRDAVETVRACLAGETPDMHPVIEKLRRLHASLRLGPSTAAIVEEARRRGIPVRRLNTGSFVQLGLGRSLRRIKATLSDQTSIIGVEIAQDKDLTKRILGNIGLSVPAGQPVSTVDEAVEAASVIGYPVILKPRDGSQGRGISGCLNDEAAVRVAWPAAASEGTAVIVETHTAGRDHRVLVVNGKVVAVAERIAAHVIGDGRSAIRELIAGANLDPRRGEGHGSVLTHLPADPATEAHLALSGRTLDAIPDPGERVFLRATANLSTGGTSIDRTDEIHPDNVTACELAASVVGLDIAGLDILTPDISVPFHENGAVIIEVNAAPGIRMHTDPVEGKPRNVAGAILDMLYPAGARTSIPIIAVTGTNGKTTTTRLVSHLFRHTGRTVGFSTTDGVYLQNRLVASGDMTGPFAAGIVLSNPIVEVAVLETARGGILRSGLGFEECDVGIVLNVSGDHLGLHGIESMEELAEVKAVVPAVVKRRGHAVLNADDPLVRAMSERTSGDVVLFSAEPDGANAAVTAHVEDGGTAACIEQDTFVIRRGRLRIPIAATGEVPLTIGGAARFQYQNILAAIAAAYVQGMRYEDIRAGLMSFFPSPSLTPGRMNLLRVGRGHVLVDYAHNPAAMRGLMELVGRIDATRRIGVLAGPGDRRDEDLRALGRSASGFDYAILKEDDNLRGRQEGEVIELLREGLVEGGMAPDRIESRRWERDAVTRGLELMREHDLLVILAVNVSAVLEQLRPISTSL